MYIMFDFICTIGLPSLMLRFFIYGDLLVVKHPQASNLSTPAGGRENDVVFQELKVEDLRIGGSVLLV